MDLCIYHGINTLRGEPDRKETILMHQSDLKKL